MPPQHLYYMQPYLRRRRRMVGLAKWFAMGMGAAIVLLMMLTPLFVRALPPRYVAVMPGFLQCLHPDFCRELEANLPGVEAPPENAADLLFEAEQAQEEAPIPTLIPTSTPLPTPMPTPVEVAAALPEAPAAGPPVVPASINLPASAQLYSLEHISQGYNNCGPSSMAMVLNYWGYQADQYMAADYLKPEPMDNNVTPMQLADYVNTQVPGMRAVYRFAGDASRLKQLVFASYPVIVETEMIDDGLWYGHHRVVTGYNDSEGSFYMLDPESNIVNGNRGYPIFYEQLDQAWQPFSRVYVVVYPAQSEQEIARILGKDWDFDQNVQRALELAQEEAQYDFNNPFVWFNMGSMLVLQGQYERAAVAYDEAYKLGTLPRNMLWYQFGPYEAYLHANRPYDVIAMAQVNLNNSRYLEENHYYKGMAHLALGEYDKAEREFYAALEDNSNFMPARQALDTLQQSS